MAPGTRAHINWLRSGGTKRIELSRSCRRSRSDLVVRAGYSWTRGNRPDLGDLRVGSIGIESKPSLKAFTHLVDRGSVGAALDTKLSDRNLCKSGVPEPVTHHRRLRVHK
jgi:hypothetical protein